MPRPWIRTLLVRALGSGALFAMAACGSPGTQPVVPVGNPTSPSSEPTKSVPTPNAHALKAIDDEKKHPGTRIVCLAPDGSMAGDVAIDPAAPTPAAIPQTVAESACEKNFPGSVHRP